MTPNAIVTHVGLYIISELHTDQGVGIRDQLRFGRIHFHTYRFWRMSMVIHLLREPCLLQMRETTPFYTLIGQLRTLKSQTMFLLILAFQNRIISQPEIGLLDPFFNLPPYLTFLESHLNVVVKLYLLLRDNNIDSLTLQVHRCLFCHLTSKL